MSMLHVHLDRLSHKARPTSKKRPRRLGSLLLFFLLPFFLGPGQADARVVVKMATLAPDGSVWDKILSDMGAEWQEATGGEVVLRIYPGGVAGDEPDLIRKMRIGQLQAAALTVAGLVRLDPSFRIFEIPMFFDSYDELYHVLEELRPEFDRRLEAQGYVLLHWMHGGWVHLFSRDPIRAVDDLRPQKLFVWAGHDELVKLWQENGFKPVALAATDIMTGLETGMIDVLPSTPLAALSLQWFRQTTYMQKLGLAPLVGALVIKKDVWEKLSPESRTAILEAAAATEKRLAEEVPVQDAEAVEQMSQRGLEVIDITAEQAAEWEESAEDFSKMRFADLGQDIFELARKARDAYREAATSPSGSSEGGSSRP